LNLFVIQSVRGRILQPLSINQRNAAPRLYQRHKVRLFAGSLGSGTFRTDRTSMLKELADYDQLFWIELLHDVRLAEFRDDVFILVKHLLDLDRIVSEYLGRCIDPCQTAADHDRRQTYLKV